MNLLLVYASEFGPDNIVSVAGPRAHHVRHVLKATPGETIRIGVVDGPVGVGTLSSVSDAGIVIACEWESTPPPVPVDLLLAIPRPKVLRRLLPQLAAIGVRRIMLTNAARVERQYFDTHVLAPDHLEPLLLDGLAQGRDTRLPLVTVHRRLKPLIEDQLSDLCPNVTRVLGEPGEAPSVATVVAGTGNHPVLIAAGPEGGWTAFELGLLQQHGFAIAGMGHRTLRSDTACIALLALVHDALRTRDASARRGPTA